MEEVTREYFYKIINPLDVITEKQDAYNYNIKLRYGKTIGQIVTHYSSRDRNQYFLIKKYISK